MNVPPEYDYVVVGSGAGGGPLAASLARAGFDVLVLEAGGDPVTGGRPYDYADPAAGQPAGDETVSAYDYQVPALHTRATRDERFRWDFFVKHYTEEARQALDTKYDPAGRGVWYPRAGALGGCTAHNAMITIYPHNGDWDRLARTLDDPSWASAAMRPYFTRVLGWLGSHTADPLLAVGDPQLLRVVASAAAETLLEEVPDPLGFLERLLDKVEKVADLTDAPVRETVAWVRRAVELARSSRRLTHLPMLLAKPSLADQLRVPLMGLFELFNGALNPNELWSRETHDEGLFSVPLATDGARRSGTREHLLKTLRDPALKGRLTIETQALATRVLFADDNTAIGVEYLKGPHLYQADPRAGQGPPRGAEGKAVNARREVVLSGGTYNTPQLLMLSGVGPAEDLARLKIPCRVPLHGVGKNLHDRYEVGVVSAMKEPFNLLMSAAFVAPRPGREGDDPAFVTWRDKGAGVYTTNGAVVCVIRKSARARQQGADPDLFIFGLPGYFKGYFPAYADLVENDHTHFTWAILKAHTNNRAGSVTLKSDSPRERPEINFRYFDEGSPGWQDDLDAVADGMRFVLRMVHRTGNAVKTAFVTRTDGGVEPPPIDPDDLEALKSYIQREAWGHHACGTCKMGPKGADDPVAADDPDGSVLDKDFRVRGTRNLRVVDASVFPDIPGFFIVAAVYMVSEKAGDVIAADAAAALARNARATGAAEPK